MVHIQAKSMEPSPPSPPRFALYAYPWALADMGVEAALDELVEVGVDGLQLALSYHVASYLTPRNQRRRLFTGDLGSAWFDYAEALPGPWPVRPAVMRDAADAVPSVLKAGADRGVQVIGWLVYLYNHELARRHPELAVRNAFGDASGSQLCPANPVVREYSQLLTRAAVELGGLTGLHAESLSYLPWDYGLLGLKATTAPRPHIGRLLGLCFCEHCREAARDVGLDALGLAAAVRDAVDSGLAAHGPGRTGSGPANDSADASLDSEVQRELDALRKVRAETTVSLNTKVARIAGAAGLRFSTTAAEPDEARSDAAAAAQLRPLVNEVRVKVDPDTSVAQLGAAISAALTDCAPGTTAFAQYQFQRFGSQGELVAAVEAATRAGVTHHRFYEYSVLTDEHVSWLRGAGRLIT